MTRNKKIISLALVGLLGASAVTVAGTQGLKSVFGEETPVVWKHYQAVAPTKDTKGIKQYWVSCADDTHVFVKPTGNVEIQEASWTDSLKASVLALNDDRAITEGDFLTWAESDNDFFAGHISNLAYDSSTKTHTFRAGVYAGTEETPLVNETDAAVHMKGSYFKVARDCGYKYLSFTLKANSVMSGYVVDRYAIATSGADWRINYQETNSDVENFATYELDLTAYDGVDCSKVTTYMGFRNSTAPQFNAVVCDVTVKDLNVTHLTSLATHNSSNSTIETETNSDGLITKLTIQQNGVGVGGGYDQTGITANYISDLKEAGYSKLYCYVRATNIVKFNESLGTPGFARYNNAASYPAFIDKWMAIDVDTATTKNLDFGVAHDGGASCPTASLVVYISYSILRINYYNNDNANHCWGIDMSKFTLENASAGSGGVGDAVKSNGASVTVNGTERAVRFFSNYLDITNYAAPAFGDVVVFHAGTYQDPENRWNVNRIGTLTQDLTFVYVGGTFIQQ